MLYTQIETCFFSLYMYIHIYTKTGWLSPAVTWLVRVFMRMRAAHGSCVTLEGIWHKLLQKPRRRHAYTQVYTDIYGTPRGPSCFGSEQHLEPGRRGTPTPTERASAPRNTSRPGWRGTPTPPAAASAPRNTSGPDGGEHPRHPNGLYVCEYLCIHIVTSTSGAACAEYLQR